uniref:CRC domain-containing protein n=1 Tax=Timema shepardi TaxID=629360 RepID=A0A7R9ATN0_TIMSH|nr:unnamed protein product [Timema shepardi]
MDIQRLDALCHNDNTVDPFVDLEKIFVEIDLRIRVVSCFSLGGAELEPWSLGSVENKSSRDVYVVWSLVDQPNGDRIVDCSSLSGAELLPEVTPSQFPRCCCFQRGIRLDGRVGEVANVEGKGVRQTGWEAHDSMCSVYRELFVRFTNRGSLEDLEKDEDILYSTIFWGEEVAYQGQLFDVSNQTEYCDCFANGEFCHMCNCNNCYNNLEHEEDRQRAIKSCLERNSNAFRPKIGKGVVGDERRHNKGCNCKRSGCLKNYCECYEAKISCSHNCKCIGCRNVEELCEKKTLRDLADAAEVRVQQHVAVKSKLSAHIESIASRSNTASGAKQPSNFMTQDVVDATCQCLLAQADEAERFRYSEDEAERLIIEEFGKCLVQIIEYNSVLVYSPHEGRRNGVGFVVIEWLQAKVAGMKVEVIQVGCSAEEKDKFEEGTWETSAR